MAVSEAIAFVSLTAFLDGEQPSERRHELVGGRVYAMSGGTERHDLVAGEIARPVDGFIPAWDVAGPGDVVTTIYGDIDVDAVYDSVDATATTT